MRFSNLRANGGAERRLALIPPFACGPSPRHPRVGVSRGLAPALSPLLVLAVVLVPAVPAWGQEAPSGVTFRVNLDSPPRPQTYAWVAADLDNSNIVLGVAITHKANCSGTMGSCLSYYVSANGALSFPWQAYATPMTPPGFDETADPTCSFDRHGLGQNNGYACALLINNAYGQGGTTPESIVHLYRTDPPNLGSWFSAATVFQPPPQSAIPRPPGELYNRYAVDKPFLAIDQWPASPRTNTVYVATVYWVPEWFLPSENPPGNCIYVRVGMSSVPGNYSWTTSFTNPPSWTPPTSPGGVRVDDDPHPEHLKHEAPYLAVAPNGTIYCAWLRIDPDSPDTADILMDRSTDGGVTWGVDQVIVNVPIRVRRVPVPGGPQPTQTWINSHPKIAVDPFDPDKVYVVWAQGVGSDPGNPASSDVKFVTVTWPAPVAVGPVIQVNDPALDGGAWDYHPTVSADVQGNIHVLWYTHRGLTELKHFNLYHAVKPRNATTNQGFGGVLTTFDRRISTCLSSNQAIRLLYRYNHDPQATWPPNREPHLGNYIAGPAAYFPSADYDPPLDDIAIYPFWVYLDPEDASVPPNTDIMSTPLATNSLGISSPPSRVVSPGQSVTFELNAGPANAWRPFSLWGSPGGVDPGVLLAGTGTPICPPNPYTYFPPPIPNTARDVILPLNAHPNWLQIASGTLNNLGRARVVYTIPPNPYLGYWWCAYFLSDVAQWGFNFASNPVDLLIQQ